MLLLSSVGWLFMVTCVGTAWSYEKSYEERRFAARYDACNDHAKFILNVKDDDGDCQVRPS